jgi:hypothetical protein
MQKYDQDTVDEFPSMKVYWNYVCAMKNVAKYEKAEKDTLITAPHFPWYRDYLKRPTLAYWGVRGIGSMARALLTHLNIEFEDKRYTDRETWLADKAVLPMNFPNLPYYLDGDVKMSESMAIVRQICRKYEPTYLGRTLREQA